MPNWCNNKVTFRHSDPLQIRKVAEAFNRGNLFSTFSPVSSEAECDSCTTHWGTKWEVEADPPIEVSAEGASSITITFISAWSPPLAFYETMETLTFSVDAYYYEPGMRFCGIYENGKDDLFTINGDSRWARKHLPACINSEMGVADEMAELEAAEEEYDEEDEEAEAKETGEVGAVCAGETGEAGEPKKVGGSGAEEKRPPPGVKVFETTSGRTYIVMKAFGH